VHHRFRLLHCGLRYRDAERLHFLWRRESWINVTQRLEGANHEARTDEKHQRECNLDYDKHAARPVAFAAVAERSPAGSKRRSELRTGVLEHGNHPEQGARDERHNRGEEKNGPAN
jgi:hypothetical protein